MSGPDWRAALAIETEVELVDARGLGIVVAELTSEQQADFLTGLLEGVSAYAGGALYAGLQAAYIADHFADTPNRARDVCDLLSTLVGHLELTAVTP